MLSLLPLATLLLHIASVSATPVPVPANADKPCESCEWGDSAAHESGRTSSFGHSVSSNYRSSHDMPVAGGDSGAVQHNMPVAAGSSSGPNSEHVMPSSKSSPKGSATLVAGPTSTGSASTPDVQGQNNSSSSDDSTGGVVNPFANANKTATATMSVNGKDVTVHGVSAMGVDAYLGIPFAAPRTCPFFCFPPTSSACSSFTSADIRQCSGGGPKSVLNLVSQHRICRSFRESY